MRRFVRATWIATVLLLIPSVAIARMLLFGRIEVACVVVAAIVMPAIWWWIVGRRPRPGVGRGAAVGMLCLVVPLLFPTGCLISWIPDPHHEHGLGGLVNIAYGFVLIGAWCVALPLGAAIGVSSVLLERVFRRDPAPTRLAT